MRYGPCSCTAALTASWHSQATSKKKEEMFPGAPIAYCGEAVAPLVPTIASWGDVTISSRIHAETEGNCRSDAGSFSTGRDSITTYEDAAVDTSIVIVGCDRVFTRSRIQLRVVSS